MANTSDGGKGDPLDPPNINITTDALSTTTPAAPRAKNGQFLPEFDQVLTHYSTPCPPPVAYDRSDLATTTISPKTTDNTRSETIAGSTIGLTSPKKFFSIVRRMVQEVDLITHHGNATLVDISMLYAGNELKH